MVFQINIHVNYILIILLYIYSLKSLKLDKFIKINVTKKVTIIISKITLLYRHVCYSKLNSMCYPQKIQFLSQLHSFIIAIIVIAQH